MPWRLEWRLDGIQMRAERKLREKGVENRGEDVCKVVKADAESEEDGEGA